MIEQLILKCDDVLKKLYTFSDDLLYLGDPINDNRILELEIQIGFQLPFDFKYILARHNSFSLSGTEVLGIGEQFGGKSLSEIYHSEHEEVGNPMFKEFLAFSPDARGNHYCLDLSRSINNICPVVFWQHDCFYSSKEEVETCNEDFIGWIEEVMIEWTLEDMGDENSDKS